RRLPGPGVDAARQARNKGLLRRALQAAGLPGPAFALVAGEPDVAAFCASRPGPFVLKPADNGGSAAVRVVKDVEEARRWWPTVRSYSPAGEGIIEEFIDGPEVSVEAVIDTGQVQVVAVTAKETAPGGLLERQHTVPAPLGASQRRGLQLELGSVLG